MESTRRTAVTAGVLFIAATAANLLGTAIEQPALTGAGYLAHAGENMTRISVGGLFELIAAGCSAGIAISLYPVLKRLNETLAMGAVAFRTTEAVFYTLGAVGLLALFGPSQSSLPAVGASLMSIRQEAILAGVFAFGVGALMYYAVMFRSRLVPRWLSGWGVAAALLVFVACMSALFSHNPVTSYVLLVLPIAVQEMVLAVWLIVKGFSSTALATKEVPRMAAAA